MGIKKDNKAVSEIIGSILLLAIAVTAISVVYVYVLSDKGPAPETYVTVIGKMETGDNTAKTVAFENQRGETLGPDTEIILTIAGQQKPPKKISDFPYLHGGWDIGEKLFPVQNLGDLTDVQIDATIVDKESNSVVFWGRLQEGYVVPPLGRGGMWHFNESWWNGTTSEVKDSSGNGNHGTAYNGANTTNNVVSTTANRSGSFDGIDDYVEVADAYSLDITDQITMEAWIKPFNVTATGIAKLENKFGFTPYITHVSKNLFVIVSEDTGKKGMIQTVNITPYGQLSLTGYKFENFGQSTSERNLRPIINHATNEVYVVAYIDKDLYVHLKTFNIYSNGTIKSTDKELVFNDNQSANNVPNRPSIIKVSDKVFAIAYWVDIDPSHPAVGIIKTVNISSNGTIKYTGKMAKFNDTEGYEPSIIHVYGDMFAIAYRGPSDHGYIKTFKIYSNNGTIEYTGKTVKFDDTASYEPSIVHVSGDVFAIVYRGPSDNGFVKTFNIYSNGTIKSTGINKMFESLSCFDPCIIHHSENHYVIAYSTETVGYPIGNYKIIEIADNGIITSIGSTKPFDQDRCHNPIAIKISNRVFAIAYEGFGPHPGNLITIPAEYPSDLYSKGIYKLGSYGIYANATKVYVNINTKTINASIVPNSWNYVVLTYNKDASSDQMNLYVNGTWRASRTLTDEIEITDSNLIFGDLFYGLIDEIAIHDKALTSDEILNIYNALKT